MRPKTPDELALLARRLRAVYVQERSAFETMKLGEPVKYQVPRSYDGRPAVETDGGVELQPATRSVWWVLARFLAAEDFSPEAFIEAQFDRLGPTARPPEPRQLRSAACVRRAAQFVAATAREIPLELVLQRKQAATRISYLQLYGREAKEDSYAIALLDSDLELSPLFRYCLALSIGGLRFRRIAKRFETEACFQYQRYRKHYKRHWGELLPPGFGRFSKRVYQAILTEDEGHGRDETEEEAF